MSHPDSRNCAFLVEISTCISRRRNLAALSSMTFPSCQLDPSEVLAVLTQDGELIVADETTGLRLMAAVAAEEFERRDAA